LLKCMFALRHYSNFISFLFSVSGLEMRYILAVQDSVIMCNSDGSFSTVWYGYYVHILEIR
jgi:hypothetical protein